MDVIAINSECESRLSDDARRRISSAAGEPLFYADWLRAVFIHYEADPEALQRETPFELDLDDGRACVSLVAFTMRDMRLRIGGRLAAFLMKPIATHEFLNVRTYVRHQNETGIYFLAEWLSNPFSVLLGPLTFGLPYRLGRLEYQHEDETGDLHGAVSVPKKSSRLEYVATLAPNDGFQPCAAGSREEFLMERYTAFTERNGVRRFFRIWHPPWPQAPAQIRMLDESLLATNWPWFKSAKLIGANFSPGVRRVWMGRPQRVDGV